MIEFKNISKSFTKGIKAVDSLNFLFGFFFVHSKKIYLQTSYK